MTLNTLVDVRMLTTMVLNHLQALVMVDRREWTPLLCCVLAEQLSPVPAANSTRS